MKRAFPVNESTQPVAVLVSGGLDSAVLLAESLQHHSAIWPLYVRCGLLWEQTERLYLQRFLDSVRTPSLRSLTVLEMPVADLYGEHWSLTGIGVPAAGSADAAVYLPGRNVLLLAKAMLWCHLHGIPSVALASLESNPFSDATSSFFSAFESVVNQAIEGSVRVLLPYRGMHKDKLLKRYSTLPLQETFSCMKPIDNLHCGRCNKCAERRDAFVQAGVPDPTVYHREGSCSS